VHPHALRLSLRTLDNPEMVDIVEIIACPVIAENCLQAHASFYLLLVSLI
jgi:hypothetical protein